MQFLIKNGRNILNRWDRRPNYRPRPSNYHHHRSNYCRSHFRRPSPHLALHLPSPPVQFKK